MAVKSRRLVPAHVCSVNNGTATVMLRYNNTVVVPNHNLHVGQAVYLVSDIVGKDFYGAVDKAWADTQIALYRGEDIHFHWPYEEFDATLEELSTDEDWGIEDYVPPEEGEEHGYSETWQEEGNLFGDGRGYEEFLDSRRDWY